MICCNLVDARKYAVSENLKKAVDFVLKNDLCSLPSGKTVIDGNRIFINKISSDTKTADLLQYEVHHKYIDIQIDVEGDEKIYILYKEGKCTRAFDENDDYALYVSEAPDAVCRLDSEHCVFCFPDELHMPCVEASGGKVTKCIVKVLDDRG